MNNADEQSRLSLTEKVNACDRHVKALEKRLKETEFDYSRIVARKDAVYFKLHKYGAALILLAIILTVIFCVVSGTVDEVVRLKWSSSEDGLTVLFGLIAIAALGLGCIWPGVKLFRLIRMAKELKDEEITVGAKLSILRIKLEECREELEELLRKQEEQDV